MHDFIYIYILSGYLITHAVIFVIQHVQEFLRYLRFAVWWVALGVASSIGLGW